MRHIHSGVWGAALTALVLTASSARADNTADEADLRFERGVEFYKAKKYEDALAEFFTRTVEAGEVLGAGVRIEPREAMHRTLTFVDIKPGVRRCSLTLRAGLEASGAAPILAMFEEELADLPVSVRKVSARTVNDVVSVSMDVDVFGR